MKSVISLILIYCLMITSVFGQSVNPNDQLKIGKASSSADKGIVFDTNDGVSNKKLLIEKISKKLKFDGNSVQIGDGSSSSDKELIIAGALKSLKYNGTTGEFEFNDDVKLSGSLKADFLQAVNTEVAINSLLRATQGIKIGSGANEIRVSGGNLEFSNDGTLFKKFGTGTGGASTGTSILENASFEDGISTGWTSSGGTLSQQTYTNGVEGNTKYAQFIATGAGQYFETSLFTIPTNFSGGCQADLKKVNVSSNDLFKVEVLDSSANVLSTGNVKTSSWVKFPTISFVCPSAGSQIKLRVSSLSAGTIQVDDAYLGSNQNIVNLSQAKYVGSISYAGAASCTWTQNSTSFADIPANTNCSNPIVSGDVIAPDTKIPGLKLNVRAGSYFFVYKGFFYNGGIAGLSYMRLTDGVSYSNTQTGPYVAGGSFPSTTFRMDFTSPSLKTFNLNARRENTNPNLEIQAASTDRNLEIDVYYYPSVQETAVSPEQSSWFIDANIGGSNPVLGLTSVASYSAINDSALDLVINSSKGSASAEIPCASGTASSGLTCPAVQESVGLAFTPPYAGLFEVCSAFSHTVDANPGSEVSTIFQLVETPNNAVTILQEGGQRIQGGVATGSGTTTVPRMGNKVCGTFNFTDTSKKTIRLMYEQITGGSVGSNTLVYADRNSSIGQRDISFTVRPLLSPYNRPILTGDQVTVKGATKAKACSFFVSNALSSEAVCSIGTCVTQKIIGECATSTSVTRSSAGRFTYNFPVSFWSNPTSVNCSAKLVSGGNGRLFPYTGNMFSSSSRAFNFDNLSLTGEDASFIVDCLGE